MIRNNIWFVLILIGLLVCNSCKELYYPEVVTNEKILVILGNIQHNHNPQIKLTWATQYKESKISYIDDAIVWISDDLDNDEYLKPTSNGSYAPENINFKGILGRTYTLHVEMATGEVYESTPEKILPAPQIDSLYAEPVKKIEYQLNGLENLIALEKVGLEVKTNLSSRSDSTCFFRFKTGLYTQSSYIRYPNDARPQQVYLWSSTMLDKPNSIGVSYFGDSGQILPEYDQVFLEYIYNPLGGSNTTTQILIEGWVVSTFVYSLSSNAYNFYSSISRQLDAGNRIFSPIPSQVESNIICLNNENRKVVGLFEACDEVVCYKAFKWTSLEEYRSFELDTFPQNIGAGEITNHCPEFWVSF